MRVCVCLFLNSLSSSEHKHLKSYRIKVQPDTQTNEQKKNSLEDVLQTSRLKVIHHSHSHNKLEIRKMQIGEKWSCAVSGWVSVFLFVYRAEINLFYGKPEENHMQKYLEPVCLGMPDERHTFFFIMTYHIWCCQFAIRKIAAVQTFFCFPPLIFFCCCRFTVICAIKTISILPGPPFLRSSFFGEVKIQR